MIPVMSIGFLDGSSFLCFFKPDSGCFYKGMGNMGVGSGRGWIGGRGSWQGIEKSYGHALALQRRSGTNAPKYGA